jgi:hypothetical protein
VPQLLTLLECPAIGALVDGNDKLLGFLEEFEEVSFSSFHGFRPLLWGTTKQGTFFPIADILENWCCGPTMPMNRQMEIEALSAAFG